MRFFTAALSACLFAFSAHAADVPRWRVLTEKSEIGFSVTYGKQEIKGSFPAYEADIRFDAAQLDKSTVTVKIDTAKFTSEDKDAKENLPLGEWFAVAKFPSATFTSTTFRILPASKPQQYEADGNLTIRDKTVPATFRFTLDTFKGDGVDEGKTFAQVIGEMPIKRLDFGVGQGEWASTSSIKDEVAVKVRIEAVTP